MGKVKINRDKIGITNSLNDILDKLGKEEILVDLGEYTEVSIRPLGWIMKEFKYTCGQSYKNFTKYQDNISQAVQEVYGSLEVGTVGNCVINLFYDFMDEAALTKDRTGNIYQKRISDNQWKKKWDYYVNFCEKNPTLRLYSKPIEETV